MSGKVEICGVNTSALKVLKNEETERLLRESRQGDMQAREKLIYGNLRLVLSVIQKFGGRSDSADDLFQVGCIGLIKAIDNFDVNLGVRFSTYGVPMIVGEVRRYLRDNAPVRVSRSIRDKAYKILQEKERIMTKTQREPTVEELSKSLGMAQSEIVMCLDALADPVSLYEPVYTDGADSVCVLDQVRDNKNNADSWLDRIVISESVKKLGDREKTILARRFYDGKTQMEVASEIGISQAQVSRLEKEAINKIKKYL